MSIHEGKFTFDNPISFTDEILFYSATMKDYYQFYYCAEVLLIDKDSVPDIEVISMAYLDYLFKLSQEDSLVAARLYFLLSLVTKTNAEDIKLGVQDEEIILKIGKSVFNSSDFDKMKEIICEQNLLRVADTTIAKELRDLMSEAKRYKQKISGEKPATLEDQVVCVMISTALTLEEIENLSIRKFIKILERVDHKLHYEIYLSAHMSGFADLKDKSILKHWMANLDKDRFDDVKISLDEVKNSGGLKN